MSTSNSQMLEERYADAGTFDAFISHYWLNAFSKPFCDAELREEPVRKLTKTKHRLNGVSFDETGPSKFAYDQTIPVWVSWHSDCFELRVEPQILEQLPVIGLRSQERSLCCPIP